MKKTAQKVVNENRTTLDDDSNQKQKHEPDFESIARLIVRSLAVKANEHVLISGGVHQFELLAKIAIHVSLAGGFYSLSVSNDELFKRMTTDIPDEILSRPITSHDRYNAMLYDASIVIDPMTDDTLFADVPHERFQLGLERKKEFSDLVKTRRRRTIFMAWPTPAKAKECGMSHEAFKKLYFEALAADISDMTRRADKIFTVLKAGGATTITSPRGTKLSFTLDPTRRVMIDTGQFNEELVRSGDITKNLPCGEVYTTAVETTVEGIAVFDLVYLDGKPIEDLRLEFKNGILVDISARTGLATFMENYNSAHGHKDRIGELGIGINPALRKPIGHTLLDEKIFGSVHLALGENRMYGGLNEATIHWDFVMQKPTLIVEGTTVLRDGKFVL